MWYLHLYIELYLLIYTPLRITALSWQRGLCNSMKLWIMPCRAIQDRQLIVETSDKMWSTGEGNGKPPRYTCHENLMNCIKGQKYLAPKDESPRSEGVQYVTEEEQRRITNRLRMNKAAGPKQIRCSVVDVSGNESKIWCCKEQYCIGTWNVRSMNQGKLDVVKQEMVRINTDILGINELKWMGMGKFNSEKHYIYYCGQESHRRNGVALIINKRVQNTGLGYNLKNDRMISVHLQGRTFNITEFKCIPLPQMLKKGKLISSMKT